MNRNDHSHEGNHIPSLVVAQHFLRGVASIFDFRGVLLSNGMKVELGHNIDAIALRNDWCLVGQDMYSALSKFQRNTIPELHK